MNNSAQLKDGELRLFVLFLLIITEICSSVALECEICLKFVKP